MTIRKYALGDNRLVLDGAFSDFHYCPAKGAPALARRFDVDHDGNLRLCLRRDRDLGKVGNCVGLSHLYVD